MNHLPDEKLSRPLVLIIEDDNQMRRFLRATLAANGYDFVEAAAGQDGLRLVLSRRPDLIILDLGLPDVDGLEVARQVREWSTMPIVVLSARERENDKIAALDAGADDYLTKPFGTGELLARMRVAMRHATRAAAGTEDPIFSTGDLKVDIAHRQVFVDDREIHLTPIQYKVLLVLVQHAGKVVTQHQLLNQVWGPGYETETHYLRIYMAQLRHKLEADATHPRYLLTEPGVGYRLKTD